MVADKGDEVRDVGLDFDEIQIFLAGFFVHIKRFVDLDLDGVAASGGV